MRHLINTGTVALLAIMMGCATATSSTPPAGTPVSPPGGAATGAWELIREADAVTGEDRSSARLPSDDSSPRSAFLVWRCLGEIYEVLLILEGRDYAEPLLVQDSFGISLDTAPPEPWPAASVGSDWAFAGVSTGLKVPREGEPLNRWTRTARSSQDLAFRLAGRQGESHTFVFTLTGITEAHNQLPCRPALPPSAQDTALPAAEPALGQTVPTWRTL